MPSHQTIIASRPRSLLAHFLTGWVCDMAFSLVIPLCRRYFILPPKDRQAICLSRTPTTDTSFSFGEGNGDQRHSKGSGQHKRVRLPFSPAATLSRIQKLPDPPPPLTFYKVQTGNPPYLGTIEQDRSDDLPQGSHKKAGGLWIATVIAA